MKECVEKPKVTFDLMSNSPYLQKEAKSNLLGETYSLSEVTYSVGSLFTHPFL